MLVAFTRKTVFTHLPITMKIVNFLPLDEMGLNKKGTQHTINIHLYGYYNSRKCPVTCVNRMQLAVLLKYLCHRCV